MAYRDEIRAPRPWSRAADGPDDFDLLAHLKSRSYLESGVVANVNGGIASGGVYLGYFPASDKNGLSIDERQRLQAMGGFTDLVMEYKVHLNPQSPTVKRAAAAVIDTCRKSVSLRESLYQMKFWSTERPPLPGEKAPRIALYPRNGTAENATTIVAELAPVIGGLGIRGHGDAPRFNMSVLDNLWYVAQGSGSDKEAKPAYRDLFDPATNWAIALDNARVARQMIDNIRASLGPLN